LRRGHKKNRLGGKIVLKLYKKDEKGNAMASNLYMGDVVY